jgi:hypothetical protein
VNVYALPRELDYDRLVSAFEVLRDILVQRGSLRSLDEIALGQAEPRDASGLTAHPLTISVVARPEGLRDLLTFLRLMGLLTTGDALTDAERRLLLQRTEEESPAGIVALEQFLSTDLLRYAREPRPFEEQLRKSFSSEAFNDALREVLQTSLLRSSREVLGGQIGAELTRAGLWPLPLTLLQEQILEASTEPGWIRGRITVLVHTSGTM